MAEVEIVVEEATEEEEYPLLDATHKLFQAGLGAMLVAEEAMAGCLVKLIEKGETVEKETRELIGEKVRQRKHQVRKVTEKRQKKAEEAEDTLQGQVEELLERMNVPTKSDIDALGAKITQLGKKVDELKEAQES